MGQILERSMDVWFGQVCIADVEADLPTEVVEGSVSSPGAVSIPVGEPQGDAIIVQIFVGDDERPTMAGLEDVFAGDLTLTNAGLLVFSPTGDEEFVSGISEGSHHVRVLREGFPARRVVFMIDA
jgi:hypothetical protein